MIFARRGMLDKVMVSTVMLIALCSILFAYSATLDRGDEGGDLSSLVMRQGIWIFVGFVFLFLIANSNYLKVLNFAYLLYALNLAALLFLLFFGGERYGARRWIAVGPVSLQPSEFVKITVILALAAFVGERREKMRSLKTYLGAILIVMPAAALIFLQPDLGTALVLAPILFSILFICGAKIRYMLLTAAGVVASMPVFWGLLKDYQKSRLMVFINPNIDPLGAGYTIIQSKIAIGSGGLFGKGWLNGTQSYLKFLPERHTDFIFSVIGEEWGFLGAIFLISLFAILIARGIRVIDAADNIYGRAIATGVITLIAFQMFVNISMTIGIMPVVGLPLPMISYGGSNTIATLIGIGFLLSIGRQARR
ncbi:MAG: rod shape-determining protein RodA [Candidatus Tantalella remota]|nr:rod shape-determining protein RodA [Candidatus Tantalella remota]